MSNTNEHRKRRKFTDEFKADAVALVEESGGQIAKVAKELGIYDSSLGNWVRQAREHADGEPTSEGRAEIRELKRELERVMRERDILGKSNSLLLGTRPEERVMKIYSFIAEEQANNSVWTICEMCWRRRRSR